MMISQEEEDPLIDYSWDEEELGPIEGYGRSYVIPATKNNLSDGPVQVLPTARGAARVTSVGLTSPPNDAASDDGLLDLALPGSSEAAEGDAMVVGPLHDKGLKSLPTTKRPNQRSRLRARAVRAQGNLGTAAKPLLRMGNGAPEASPRQGAPVTSDLARGVASGPPTIRPSLKDGRPDLVRARCKTPSEGSSNKFPKNKPSRKTGQPVLSVGSNLRRSGTLASIDKTSRDEVLDDGQS